MNFTDHLEQILCARDFSGVVRVQRGEQVLCEAAAGLANRPWQAPNRPDTRFRIASIAKMFTAVAVLQLADAGRLKLDDPIHAYLDLRETCIPTEVRIEQLLSMTSGIADWFDESGDWETEWAALCRAQPIYLLRSNQDYLPLFVHKTPLAAPGAQYHYNGAGYILLGLLIERVSGRPYFDYVCEHIFAAAHMDTAAFVALDEVSANVAEGYVPVENEAGEIVAWKRNIYSTTPQAAADGGATASAADLVRFSQALRGGRLLSAHSTQAILTPRVDERAEHTRGYRWQYGYGNLFLLDGDGRIVRWGHTGEEDGVSGRLFYYPTRNLDVVILSNQSWSSGELGWQIHDLIQAHPL